MCADHGFCFFEQKTAYELRISDWRSDVCSSDLPYNYRSARDAIRAVRPRRALPFREQRSSSDARTVSIARASFLAHSRQRFERTKYGRSSLTDARMTPPFRRKSTIGRDKALDHRPRDIFRRPRRREAIGLRQYGRASCREKVCSYGWIRVGAVSLKKKNIK